MAPRPNPMADKAVKMVYGSTAFGEPLPPLFIFDSAASTDEGRRLNSAWAIDLPKVRGVFGGDLVKTWDSFLASAPNGSTDDAIFEQCAAALPRP